MERTILSRVAASLGGLCLMLAVLSGSGVVAHAATATTGSVSTESNFNVDEEFAVIKSTATTTKDLAKTILIPLIVILAISMFLIGFLIAKGSMVVRSLTSLLMGGFATGIGTILLKKVSQLN